MTEKKQRRNKKLSIEDLYQNKNFVPPKEKHLETIFEEPRQSKDGAPILTSVRKYKRYLHFDPTEGKIHKRKLKAKKCINKIKTRKLRTRSAAKAIECEDISLLYILQAIGESSDSEMEETQQKTNTDAIDQLASTTSADDIKSDSINDSRSDLTKPSGSSDCVPLQSTKSECVEEPHDNKLRKTDNSQKVFSNFNCESSSETLSLSNEEKCDIFSVEKEQTENDQNTSRSSCIVS